MLAWENRSDQLSLEIPHEKTKRSFKLLRTRPVGRWMWFLSPLLSMFSIYGSIRQLWPSMISKFWLLRPKSILVLLAVPLITQSAAFHVNASETARQCWYPVSKQQSIQPFPWRELNPIQGSFTTAFPSRESSCRRSSLSPEHNLHWRIQALHQFSFACLHN